VKEKKSDAPDQVALCLKLKGEEQIFNVALSDMEAFQAYRTELEKKGTITDKEIFEDLQKGLSHTLRCFPELKKQRVSDIKAIDNEGVKKQKQLCKRLLFFHPDAPLKAYLQSHLHLRCTHLEYSQGLLFFKQPLTPKCWYVYFLAKRTSDPREEHAMLGWEGVYNYGQRVIRMAHLTIEREEGGLLAKKPRIIIDYYDRLDIASIESFPYDWVAFPTLKQQVKAMENAINYELGHGVPAKYKSVLSSSTTATLSNRAQKRVVTNCQKWALEKLEECLGLIPMTLQKQMNIRPLSTLATLRRMAQAMPSIVPESKQNTKFNQGLGV
jgi:hypothetical protein